MVSTLMTMSTNDADSPEPPAELLGFVQRASSTPVMQKVNGSLARFGYVHTEPGTISNTEAAEAGLLAVRGLTLDTFYPDTAEGRAAWKASQR